MFLALFILGLVQGLTEFLPVSSSGHLVLLTNLFGIEESLFISILLHVATLFSILVVFHKDVWQMICHPFSKQTINLAVATIPTCVIVLILMPLVKLSFVGDFLPICFLFTAVLLCFCQRKSKKKVQSPMDTKKAIIMGIAQGFAVFPGISRSGSTVGAGLAAGGEEKEVAKFSFLMSIPIILLSMVMEIFELATSKSVLNFNPLAVTLSFVTAFVVGIFAIKFMLNMTKKSKLHYFSAYLLLIAIVSLFIV